MTVPDLNALERGCNEVESWPNNTASVTLSAPQGSSWQYKPGVSLSIGLLRSLIAELRACRQVVAAAKELDSPCEHERGFCIAHGTVRLPCQMAELRAAIAALERLE